jgi:hypothetical protein
MKDLTKQLVLKRDQGCIICNLYSVKSPTSNSLHVHHEWQTYGNLGAGVPLQNWPWRNFKQQMVTLCNHHHALRTHDESRSSFGTAPLRGSLIRDIRLYLMGLYPEYFDQFDVLGGV